MSPSFSTVAVLGAGTMGHGIAQICAQAGCDVYLFDIEQPFVDRGLERVRGNLNKGIARGKVTEAARDATLERLRGGTDLAAAVETADLIVEAVPEKLALKQSLVRRVGALCSPQAVIGTNTSSLSVAKIAQAAPDPSRVIGLHFFNPVHIMKLLEVIRHPGLDPQVLAAALAFGARIRKTTITITDSPGFATSRLGIALGMEAIRMLEDGVGSAEDIDAAMVLGYRHPVGPLKLSDMVGLDVRMHIGEYLARELGNPAFEPPALMRRMVAEGRLGKKSGRGFYDWPRFIPTGPTRGRR